MNKKLLLMVRSLKKIALSAICVVALLLGSLGELSAQNAQSDVKVSIKVVDKSLADALIELDKVSPLSIVFNVEQLKSYPSISITAEKLSTAQVIERILRNTKLTYKLRNNSIVIAPAAEMAKEKGDLTIIVEDRSKGRPLADATCYVEEYALYAVTNSDGVAVISGIPAGKITVNVDYVGFTSFRSEMDIVGDKSLDVSMMIASLKVDDVTVVATQNSFGKAGSSKISRQAIDHIQATSLSDVLTLLPGSTFGNVDDMTSPQQAYMRTLFTDKNNANGVSVIVDGVPMSNNTEMYSSAYNVLGGGIDLRKISTDNIESVEVITGVASAEHGDLSTGAIVVNSKQGATPLSIRGKINPSIYQTSLSKGWALGGNGGTLNASADYLSSSGDPRVKRESYDRVNARLSHSKTFGKYDMKTSLSYSGAFDSNGDDPDMVANGEFVENKDYSFSFSHSGSLKLDKLFSKNLKYVIGASSSKTDYYTTRFVVNSGGETPLYTSREEGIFAPVIVPPSYYTGGGSISQPLSLYAKVSNNFFIRHGNFNQVFNMGVEYRYEKNSGLGKYNDDDLLPLHTSDTRSVPFNDKPALQQLSAFIEDNITGEVFNMPFKVQAGLRFSSLQPFADEYVWSLSPRLNIGLAPTKWLDVRFAYGESSKIPGSTYLYPDPKYIDRMIANYSVGGENFLRYQTYIINPNNSELKNSTTRRMELGLDFKLRGDRTLSLTAYRDRNDTGFGGASIYTYYDFNQYNVVTDANNNLMLDMNDIIATDRVLTTNGSYANNSGSENSGVEINFDFGRIEPIKTNIYLRGAYIESKSFSTGLTHSNPVGYSGDVMLSPYKMVYNVDNTIDVARMFSTQLQAVCYIPVLELVASGTMQVVWYNYSYTQNSSRAPFAYMDNNLVYHEITNEMLSDPDYKIGDYLLQNQIHNPTIDEPVTQKPIWMINARLTKNITDYFGVSFYANNVNYYEPWQSSSISSSESQRNTSTFAFGLELRLTLIK